ncbi:hypothetical protein SBY92_000454 [Candida maltosa Xu316]|uniref:SPX domain-containing protein n=1 Tax=Candida maltosa (strain Xu316) TaxID=1245528 RepID=M3IRI9_CANMX|nr:hypothetical protein G210_0184 [Candida maltosa Xu316]
MKFGDNFQHLSIPQWKNYNLDYNQLKYKIKQITTHPSSSSAHDLSSLKNSFVDNFDYINLFIKTKFGELSRKFLTLETQFNNCLTQQQSNYELIDDLFYKSIELSIDIKNLSKFIILQKIAIKKIFKKFLKYYPDKSKANKLINYLKNYFLSNLNANINLNDLTLKLTNLINIIKYHQSTNAPQLNRSNSLFSLSSTITNNTAPDLTLPVNDTTSLNTSLNTSAQQLPNTEEYLFDLNLMLKKNFQLHCLINQDSTNDLIINFNLLFQLKNFKNDNLISYTYLTKDYLVDEPALILSHQPSSSSIIIAPIGGLRKYSYCILPNSIIQVLIHHLNDKSNTFYKNQLVEYFATNHQHTNLLTKKTIDYIIQNNLKPTLKLFCNRKRYLIELDQNVEIASNLSGDQPIDKDYLITLDSNIMTTNNPDIVNDLSFKDVVEKLDLFPHNHLSISSNDIHLSNFESSLITRIDSNTNSNGSGLVKNLFNNNYLRCLPKKIQSLLNNHSLILFKGLNFYQYQLSCYYNIIPKGDLINNHYTNLLNLNLLKFLENVNNDATDENKVILKKHKSSLSIQSLPINQHSKSISHSNSNSNSRSVGSIFDNPSQRNDDDLDEEDEVDADDNDSISLTNQQEDIYLQKLKRKSLQHHHHHLHPQQSYNFIDKLNQWKQRLFNHQPQPSSHNPPSHENPFFIHESHEDEEDVPLDPYTKLLSIYHTQQQQQNYSTYDSINDDPIPYYIQKRNTIQNEYELNYDRTLSYVYFSLNIISLFLSGIQLGILVISMFTNTIDDYKFLIRNNLQLVIVLILAIVTSLMFNLISLNLLKFNRFNKPPYEHYVVVYTTMGISTICCLWSVVLLWGCI